MPPRPAAFFPVIVTDRPQDDDHAPAAFDQIAARIVPAGQLQKGDRVLAAFGFAGENRMLRADHFVDTYPAAPAPVNPDCGCPGHDGPPATGAAVVVTDGFPWDLCEVWDADAPALIIPARRPSLAELVALQPGSTATHDGDTGAPDDVVRHPVCGGPMFYVDGPYRCAQCWATLAGGTPMAPNCYWDIRNGWLVNVEYGEADCAECDEDGLCAGCRTAGRPLPRLLTVLH